MPAEPTAAQQMLGDFAPKLVSLTDDVLFGDIWERPGLSKRDRSLITVAALVALYRTDQLPFHLGRALENGVTKDELVEYLKNQAKIHLAQFVDAGRKEGLAFDELYKNLKKLKGDKGLSNSEIALSVPPKRSTAPATSACERSENAARYSAAGQPSVLVTSRSTAWRSSSRPAARRSRWAS